MNPKYNQLIEYFKNLGRVAVAFSGGVDSTFLLAAARNALGPNALAVIGKSPTYPSFEFKEAVSFAKSLDAAYEVVTPNELEDDEFRHNPPNRCFICKSTLFGEIQGVATKRGITHIAEGSNADDVGDFRPGMDAARKLGVLSPLRELDITKDEIRLMSKELGLPTWNKPAFACLSSRIPYGDEISVAKLNRIEQAEACIRALGIRQFRVRDHRDIARIEVEPPDIAHLAEPALRAALVDALKKAGYKYVCLDLQGYRSGAMNEVLAEETKKAARRQGE